MSTKPEPAQSGLKDEDQSEDSGDSDGPRSGEKNRGAACKDLSCSDKRNFIAEDDKDVKKVDIKPVTRGKAAAKKDTLAKPPVKKRRVSLDESKQRKQPARII